MTRVAAVTHARAAAVVLLAAAALIVYLVDWRSPVRTTVALAFLLVGPGLAITELLAIEDPVMRLAIASGASLALDTLVAVALLYAHHFSPELALVLLVGFTGAAIAAAIVRAARESGSARGRP
jgi:hypothetical protein